MSTLLATIIVAMAACLGVMFSAWRPEPHRLGLHALAAPVPTTALFTGLVALPLAALVVAVVAPLALAAALGWGMAAPLPGASALGTGAVTFTAAFFFGALVAEGLIGLGRGGVRALFGFAIGAAGWVACGAGGATPLAGPVAPLAELWGDVGMPAVGVIALGTALLLAAWILSAAARPSPADRRLRGALPVAQRGPITANATATLAVIAGDAHVRRAIALSAALALAAALAAKAAGLPAAIAVLTASTIVMFGALSAVLVGIHSSQVAAWLWRTAPVAGRTRLSVSFGSAAAAALLVCVTASAGLALAAGAEANVVAQLLPHFLSLTSVGVVVGVIAPRRPGRLFGDLAQLAALLIGGAVALHLAEFAGGAATQSIALAVALVVSVGGAGAWCATREEHRT